MSRAALNGLHAEDDLPGSHEGESAVLRPLELSAVAGAYCNVHPLFEGVAVDDSGGVGGVLDQSTCVTHWSAELAVFSVSAADPTPFDGRVRGRARLR